MKCLDKGLIQKYLDGECSLPEESLVEEHLKKCPKCCQQLEYQRENSDFVRTSFSFDESEMPDIQQFHISVKEKEKKTNKKHLLLNYYKYIAISLAAACIVLTIILIQPKKQEPLDDGFDIFAYTEEYDANLPLSKQNIKLYFNEER